MFFRERPVPPPTTVDLVLGKLKDTVSADGNALYVEGTLRNTGSRDVRNAKVWLEALDATGNVVARGEAFPTPQAIPAGGSATFVVELPNDPAIRRFHAQAIAR